MEIVFLLIGLLIGVVLGKLLFKNSNEQATNDEAWRAKELQLSGDVTALQQTMALLKEQNGQLKTEISDKQTTIIKLETDLAKSITQLQHTELRLAEQKQDMEQLNQRLKTEFENVASKILDEKTQKFTDQNKNALDIILTPLKDKIKDFEEKVQKVYDTEAAERNMLKGEIKQLMGLNQQMHQDAQNLTKALRGDNKTQGNWGEFILESILQKSGLVKDREYKAQESITTEDGKRLQPDVVINLPDGKCLIIDSKVSLSAYERYVSSDDETAKAIALKEHVQSFKSHTKGLADKNYQNLYGIKSLDFVLLFVPIESAFAAAVQQDNNIFNDAFERNIVIVSPSTLLATLRTVANIWRQEYQNKNAIEIANKAGDMYDKFVGFADDMITVGSKMADSKKAYDAAMNKLTEGTGNLIKRADDLKKLGAKTSKNMDQRLLDRAELN
jgi:DNA recombination protein RmuC